ncbi:MAG: HDIG domain-containing protein [Pirellulaceae bacterium]|nr:HDIG domain-containing protein [Pirellulaceae bacterium]
MSYASIRRPRNRAAGLGLPPNLFARGWETLRRPDVLLRLGVLLVAWLLLWAVTGAGIAPFAYRTGDVPPRKIVARVDFSREDEAETLKRREEARRTAEAVYINNPRLLEERRQELTNKVARLVQGESFEAVEKDPELIAIWREFLPPDAALPAAEDKRQFEALKTFFTAGMDNNRYDEAVKRAIGEVEKFGLLKELKHAPEEGSQVSILVLTGNNAVPTRASVEDVRIDKAKPALRQRLEAELKVQGSMVENATTVADLTNHWLASRLPETLSYDKNASQLERDRAIAAVPPVLVDYRAGIADLAPGGKPLTAPEIALLREEYDAWRANLTWQDRLGRSLALAGMYCAMSVLCGYYIYHRRHQLLSDLRRLMTLLAAIVVTITFGWIAAADQWRAEIIPLLIFGMTAAIAYEKELALLLTAAAALILSFSLEQGLAEFVILLSSVAAAILLLRRIRSRTKLIYVGAITGLVVMLTTIGVGTLVGQAFGATSLALSWTTQQLSTTYRDSFLVALFVGAAWFGFCSLLAGVLMTGLLPFIERMFDVQTDISLLELGDVQHPLLQELVRRAPGTYNHSINVASIAETAAESIGANGLLVRVGAYFHDIGKMLKPSYFVENQGPDGNRHESLQPAMSTLVIIAHVKDGADLARRHHLPQSLIDFIEQHHGTTLVEFFYRREAARLERDPDAGELDETTFRYPGPKPQTKEAGVLMLADVVESASRALVDPTPARIESLVHDLAMKRLLDGQFDECGLTLSELRLIEDSLVKSLTAVYHGRVKYPEHQTV